MSLYRSGPKPSRPPEHGHVDVLHFLFATDKLHEFVDSLGLPVIGYVRNTQNYIHLAARGLTLFDVAPGRVEKDLAQWESIRKWLDRPNS